MDKQQMMQGMAPQGEPDELEEAGRGTDQLIAHMTMGEVVIPREFLDDPDVAEMLQAVFQQNGIDIGEFTVGHEMNKINPETGYPEFFKVLGFKVPKVKNLFNVKNILPVAASLAFPGVGTAIGSALGAGAAYAPAVGGAVIGGLTGGVTGGGIKGALRGAALGGVTGGLSSAAGGNFDDTAFGRGVSGLAKGASNFIGSGADSVTLPGIGKTSLNNGTGIRGAFDSIRNQLPSLSSSTGSGSSGGGSSYLPLAANVLGGFGQDKSLKKQQQQLLGANQEQLANLEGFDPSTVENEPGYKFAREQGQEALNRGMAAEGGLYSGRALKAAGEYQTNYAANGFREAYARFLQKAQAKNQLIGAGGDVRANATGARSENISQSLSNALGSRVGKFGGGLTIDELRKLGYAG